MHENSNIKLVYTVSANKYSLKHRFSPVSIVPPMLRTHFHLHVALARRTNGENMETVQKAVLFRKSRSSGYKRNSTPGFKVLKYLCPVRKILHPAAWCHVFWYNLL